jgi:hypothetical protein
MENYLDDKGDHRKLFLYDLHIETKHTKDTWLQIVKRGGFVVHVEWIFSIDIIAFKP